MKRRSREISIFSMSALDLFASALGAFILIAIVVFPYFPNTTVACPAAQVCPVPAPVPSCPICPSAPTPDPAPPSYEFPHLDLVIALDITGSMGEQVADLKAEIDQLTSVLLGLTPSFGMGIVAYGDTLYQDPVTTFPLREISGSPGNQANLREFVVEMDTGMGMGSSVSHGAEEAFLDALSSAVNMTWRARAEQRMIVMVTDNPAYENEVDQAIAAAGRFSASGGRVSTVFIDTDRSHPTTQEFLREVATAGSGQFVQDAGGSLTANLLLSLM